MKRGRKSVKRKSCIQKLMEPPYLDVNSLYFGDPVTPEEREKAKETERIMKANMAEICRRYYELVNKLKIRQRKDPNFKL